MIRSLAAVALLAAGAASAGELHVIVVDSEGAPVPDAVITVLPPRGAEAFAETFAEPGAGPGTGAAPEAPQTKTIDQTALRFAPYVEVFRPGDAVVFRNSDRTNHHVYSFSPIRPFETIVAPGNSTAPMTLEAPGVVAVGCNIHDRMVTYLYVTDAPFAVRTGADGHVQFDDIPEGPWTVRIWQPRSRAAGQTVEHLVVPPRAGAPGVLHAELSLRPDARHVHERETLKY